jgi:hypothetical protein
MGSAPTRRAPKDKIKKIFYYQDHKFRCRNSDPDLPRRKRHNCRDQRSQEDRKTH